MSVMFKRYYRPAIFLLVALCIGIIFSDFLLCIPFLLLSAFYVGVDVFRIDKAPVNDFDMDVEFLRNQEGVLGDYVLDKTMFYGMFIKLCGTATFVDIKKDKSLEKRKKYAMFLLENKTELEASLNKFLERNPEYKLKRISGIGLVSKDLKQGDVNWEPDGYTLLKGLEFCDE